METMTNEKLVEMTIVTKNALRGKLTEAYKKVGLDATKYINGLMLPPVNSLWAMEDNMKNILSVFSNNYIDSVHFQAQVAAYNVKEYQIIAFITKKGLLDEFKRCMNNQAALLQLCKENSLNNTL